MKLTLHHINLCSPDVAALDEFYRNVLGLDRETTMQASRATGENNYDGKVAFVTDGTTQMHLAERDFSVGFRTGQIVNPLEKGHIAFRTDDMAAFKKQLEAKGIPYSDYGGWAIKGWQQIFFHDPDGNVIEVHALTE